MSALCGSISIGCARARSRWAGPTELAAAKAAFWTSLLGPALSGHGRHGRTMGGASRAASTLTPCLRCARSSTGPAVPSPIFSPRHFSFSVRTRWPVPSPSRRPSLAVGSRRETGQAAQPGQVRLIFTTVTIHYVDLPPNYEDETGLPFRRRGDLDRREVAEIFGPGMKPMVANRLLRILHGRRVAGTLDDPAYRATTAGHPQAEIDAALAYLRRTVPVDEVINAGLRAEDELADIERQLAADEELREVEEDGRLEEEGAEKDKENQGKDETEELYEKDEKDEKDGHPLPPQRSLTEQKWRARLYREAPADDVYGVGAFDAIRARNQLRSEERERLRQAEEERLRKEAEELAAMRGGGRSLERVGEDGAGGAGGASLPSRVMSPRVKKWALAATSPLQEPPRMTSWERLWPSALFVASLLTGGAVWASFAEGGLFSAKHTTSSDSPNAADAPGLGLLGAFLPGGLSPAATTVLSLVAANVAVWLLWHLPPAWRLLNRFAIVVPATPRPFSLIGAMFSHQKASHLLANMAFLWFIGMRLHEEVGRAAFLEAYFASGALAFLASMANIVLRGNLHLTTLGASGAIYGIATAYFILHKFEGFKILGVPPDPYNGVQGLGFVGLMLGLNLLALRAEKQSIDVVTHFAGMAMGALFGEYFRVCRDEQASAIAENRPPRAAWAVVMDRWADKKAKSSPESSNST